VSARRPSPKDSLYVIGVTGGIASGKSTFVRILESHASCVTIDADRIGHAVLEDPNVARALALEFGADVLDGAGRVDRGRLGPRAFASPERLATLNRIVHPPLLTRALAAIAAEAEKGHAGMCVLDAALLVEWDAGRWCDRVVTVLADPARQVEFLVARAGLTQDDAARRVALQLPNEARAAYADDVLVNDGALAEFEARAVALADALAARARAELAARAVVR
jgi:dephospho-CoA kinase